MLVHELPGVLRTVELLHPATGEPRGLEGRGGGESVFWGHRALHRRSSLGQTAGFPISGALWRKVGKDPRSAWKGKLGSCRCLGLTVLVESHCHTAPRGAGVGQAGTGDGLERLS